MNTKKLVTKSYGAAKANRDVVKMQYNKLLESIEEKESRLQLLSKIEVEKVLLKRQIRSLEEKSQIIIDADKDYKKYIDLQRRDKNSIFSVLDYEDYVAFLKLLNNTPAKNKLSEDLLDLLKLR